MGVGGNDRQETPQESGWNNQELLFYFLVSSPNRLGTSPSFIIFDHILCDSCIFFNYVSFFVCSEFFHPYFPPLFSPVINIFDLCAMDPPSRREG